MGRKYIKVIKKQADRVKLEPAHNGTESRKPFVKNDEVKNIQGITHGWLKAGGVFEWHKYDVCNEFMYVLKGRGIVRDEDKEYSFKVGDFLYFSKEFTTSKEIQEMIHLKMCS